MSENAIDSITRIAMNIFSNKGVYALLLGSGISLPAGIMSGWKVTEDLLKKLSFIQDGKTNDDVFAWYREKYHKEAEYSDLLSQLGHHSAEIGNLLWQYFEPSEDEKQIHLKEPTEAHLSIAELASKGYFKVIITTNFDRLLENAFDQKGVKYQVVSNESQLDGAVPIIHFPLTIIKVNGDYKDARVKNTEEELTFYSDEWNEYILRVFHDFGLITVGWSAIWDKAVIKDIIESQNVRYSYSFTYIDRENSNNIISLSDNCKGEAIQIEGANSFFCDLNEKIKALELIYNRNMEIDKEIAVTRVKEYIKKDDMIIRFTDLFEDETSRAINKANEYTYTNEQMTAQLYENIYTTAYTNLSVLLPMSIVAIRWADNMRSETIVNVLNTLANRKIIINGTWDRYAWLQNHAMDTIYLYGTGIACVYYRKFSLLDKLFRVKLNKSDNLASDYLIDIDNCWIIDKDIWNRTSNGTLYTPFSNYFSRLLKTTINFIDDEEDYDSYFCIFEKLLSMYFYMLISSGFSMEQMRHNVPIGKFGWQALSFEGKRGNKYHAFFEEIASLKDESPQIKGGLFEKSFERYSDVLKNVNEVETLFRAYNLY